MNLIKLLVPHLDANPAGIKALSRWAPLPQGEENMFVVLVWFYQFFGWPLWPYLIN